MSKEVSSGREKANRVLQHNLLMQPDQDLHSSNFPGCSLTTVLPLKLFAKVQSSAVMRPQVNFRAVRLGTKKLLLFM